MKRLSLSDIATAMSEYVSKDFGKEIEISPKKIRKIPSWGNFIGMDVYIALYEYFLIAVDVEHNEITSIQIIAA